MTNDQPKFKIQMTKSRVYLNLGALGFGWDLGFETWDL